MDTDKFERREQSYKKMYWNTFLNTKTIDTTDIDLEQTINVIINDNNFLKDM